MFHHDDVEITHRNGEAVSKDWDPDGFYGNNQARSLEDLEREHVEANAALAARERGQGLAESGAPGSAAAAGEEGEGQVGGPPGDAGRDRAEGGDPSGAFDRALDAAHGAPSDEEVAITRMVDAAAKERAPDVEGRIPKALETQIADIHDALARSDAAGLLGDSERAEIEAAQSWVQQAKKYAQAAAQAAVCLARGFA